MQRFEFTAPPENDGAFSRKVRQFIERCTDFFRGWRRDGANFNLDAGLTVTTLDATSLGPGLTEAVQDVVAALLAAGANVSLTYNDGVPSLTVALSGTVPVANGGTGLSALGAANTVLTVNSGATANQYQQVADAHVAAGAAIAWSKLSKSGSSLADLATRSAGALNSGNLPYAQMPTGSGSWDTGAGTTATVARALSVSGNLTTGAVLTAGVTSTQHEIKGMTRYEGASTTANVLTTFQGADTVTRLAVKVDASYEMGSGTATRDCRFKRSNASEVTVDTPAGGNCAFIVTGVFTASGNAAIGGTGSFGGGAKVLFLANATAPSSNPTGGGILYAESGALKYRGSGGTITTIAAA